MRTLNFVAQQRIWMIVICLLIWASSRLPAASLPDDGAAIGDWSLNSMIRAGPDTSPAYYLTNRLTYEKRTPSLDIACEKHRYLLRFSVEAPVQEKLKTSVAIAIDDKKPLLVTETKNVGWGLTAFLEGELSVADLGRISETKSSLSVASPALQKTFTFKASETARAIRTLRSVCEN